MRVTSHEFSNIALRNNVVDRNVVAVSVLVEHMGVSVRESSPFNILARNTNVIAILDQ